MAGNLEVRTTEDGSKTLYSSTYEQTFHSEKGALSESQHVFIEGGALPFRLMSQDRVRVLEVGFGTGLNFFLSASLAALHPSKLEYMALEKDLLTADVISPLEYDQILTKPDVWQSYLGWRPKVDTHKAMLSSVVRETPHFKWQNSDLALVLGGARERILELESSLSTIFKEGEVVQGSVDIIYHDAFSYDANSELWLESFLKHLYILLKPGGVLTTYSVKGIVRRRLAKVGFQVEKRPGPVGGKREMLVAIK
ncbi:MAG: tRNA (5-methylaminomethyl-2-thiouridine)(34)-methyltransferase MnmD [Deinococcota bacterium]